MPQLPSETRWNSQLDCVKSYLNNPALYMEIRDEHLEDTDENIGNLIDYKKIRTPKGLCNQC